MYTAWCIYKKMKILIHVEIKIWRFGQANSWKVLFNEIDIIQTVTYGDYISERGHVISCWTSTNWNTSRSNSAK